MYQTFFSFSVGLSQPINVHAGHFQALLNDIASVEQKLGLVRDEREGLTRWVGNSFENVTDTVLCDTAKSHNQWVREVYNYWASKPGGPEVLTPEMAQQVWHALAFIRVPPRRWTADYYQVSMERLFDVMVTGERDGISFDIETLTVKQAAQVVLLFSEFLDTHDARLAVPDGYDFLVGSDDYEWCSEKGIAVLYDDGCDNAEQCENEDCLFISDEE